MLSEWMSSFSTTSAKNDLTPIFPGQEEVVQFKIRAEDLAFVNENNSTVAEEGDFRRV